MTLLLRGQPFGEVVFERGPDGPGRRGALRTDRPVPARPADGRVPDAGEVLLAPDGLGDRSQLFFDVVELVPVGLEGLGIVDRLGRQALVAQSEAQAASQGYRCEQPRLE